METQDGRIVNRTRKRTLAREVEIADSFRERARGLMFRGSLPEGKALLMVFPDEGDHRIWMLGMRFPIDLVFLDSDKRVIGIHESIRPISLDPRTWKTYCAEKHARYVLELCPGTVRKTGTEQGDLAGFLDY